MRSRIPDSIQAAVAVTLVLLLIGCKAPVPSADAGLADRLEKLPTLSPKSHFETRTLASSISSGPLEKIGEHSPPIGSLRRIFGWAFPKASRARKRLPSGGMTEV